MMKSNLSPARSGDTKPVEYLDKPWLLSTHNAYLLVNAKVVNPLEGRLVDGASVLLTDGFVAEIFTDCDYETCILEENPKVIDLQGLYLCPGLIDAHVHVTATPGEVGLKGTYKNISQSMNNYRTTFLVRAMLARGFTTARDCGGADAALKDAIAEWLIPGPRLIIAGHALSQTGGHGDQRAAHEDDDPTTKCCAGHKAGISRLCDGVDDCIVCVRDEMRKGADFIKVMAGGGVSSRLNNLGHAQFLPSEFRALGIEHGNFLDKETAKYMAEKNVYLTPTLVTYNTLMRAPFNQYINGSSTIKNQAVMKSGLEALRIAEDAGVTVCFGSDLMAGMQRFQINEFSVRAQVLSSLSILRSATINAAKMMRLENEIGQIAKGLFADLVVLKENPLDDIRILDNRENILVVMKQGRVAASRLECLPVDVMKDP